MITSRWARVALRNSRLQRGVPLRRVPMLVGPDGARQFHATRGWLKDSKDGGDDPKDPHSRSGPGAAEEPGRSDKTAADAEQPSGAKEKEQPDGAAASGGAPPAKAKDDAKAADNRGAWDPPADLENVERKRRILVSQQKRRVRRNASNNMFNPKEFEEQGNDVPPISTRERLLPIQLPFRPVYPGASTYLKTTDTQLMKTLKKLNETPGWDRRVLAVMSKSQTNIPQLVTNIDDVHEIGCVCLIDSIHIQQAPDSDKSMLIAAIFPMFRARVGELVENVKATVESPITPSNDSDSALDQVTVQYMKNITAVPNEPYALGDEEIQRLCLGIIDALHELTNSSSTYKRLVDEFSSLVPQSPGGNFPQPDFLADFAASIMPSNEALQRVLGETNVLTRLALVAELAKKEVSYMRVQEGIARFSHNQSEQRNREAILHEYLRYIKKELGMDGDDKSRAQDKFRERASKLQMPDEARRIFEEELNKFKGLETSSGEYNTVKTYLDWLTKIPWGKYTKDRFDLKEAQQLLDKSHYGMKDVKDRILEFLAVGKLNGTVDGKILCLSGPPGVGKTSIAKSIADALSRKFDRFSVGGVNDPSEIKGHRRTYVAAMPGRIIQALKRTDSQNPVILIDEIDKLGAGGHHGSPGSALLEVLDPEQNKNFQDTYLEASVDLSRVLFICTANYLDQIPAPLMDRMEVIEVPGYLAEEKVQIANSHLVPKFQREAGLGSANVNFDSEALRWLVRKYTRESGVRGLSKTIEKIFRKVAINLVSEDEVAAKESAKGAAVAAAPAPAPSASSSSSSTIDPASASATTSPDEGKLRKEAESAAQSLGGDDVEPGSASTSGAGKTTAEDSNAASLIDKVNNYKLTIEKDSLQKYVGPVVFNVERMFEVLPVGVSMGLGWTPTGGTPLFIESVQQETLSPKAKARFNCTGHVGEVMGESTSIAYSFSRMFMARNYPRNRFLDHAAVHTHFPEGAIKKDGPSAGIAIVTSLLSLAMDTPMHNEVAMTGEISLTGRVLQIGGLREKAAAAKTAGAKIIIFPEDNRADWEELPEIVREGLEAHPVKHYDEVFGIVFGQPDAAQVNAAWPELKEKDEKDEKERNAQHSISM